CFSARTCRAACPVRPKPAARGLAARRRVRGTSSRNLTCSAISLRVLEEAIAVGSLGGVELAPCRVAQQLEVLFLDFYGRSERATVGGPQRTSTVIRGGGPGPRTGRCGTPIAVMAGGVEQEFPVGDDALQDADGAVAAHR